MANKRGYTIAATSGCFEIIHPEHIKLFKCMKELADKVIVFLNSDEYITKTKGEGRPLFSLGKRRDVLKSIRYITEVIIFFEDHPHAMIRQYKPDFWCKGGDYDIEKMQSTPIVRSYGGKVIQIPTDPKVHSSDIIEKIRRL